MKKYLYILAVIGVPFVAIWLSESQFAQWISDISVFPSIRQRFLDLPLPDQKAIFDQIKWRWLILGIFGAYLVFYKPVEIKGFSDEKKTWIIRLFLVIQMLYIPDLARELQFRSDWAGLYEGLPQWRWLFPHPLSAYFHQWLVIILFGSGAVLVLKKWPFSSLVWLVCLFLIFWGWTVLLIQFFGFGKIDHTYASMYVGLIGIMVWIIIEKWDLTSGYSGFKIFQAFIWGSYFFSGWEKLLFSGFQWISAHHFQALVLQHPTVAGIWIADQPFLASAFLFLALCFQLLSFLQWRFPLWGYVNGVGAIFFHLGTYFIFGIGGWQSPWIAMAIFLFPIWEQTKKAPIGA